MDHQIQKIIKLLKGQLKKQAPRLEFFSLRYEKKFLRASITTQRRFIKIWNLRGELKDTSVALFDNRKIDGSREIFIGKNKSTVPGGFPEIQILVDNGKLALFLFKQFIDDAVIFEW